jgi:hypothetical protein
MVDGMCRIRHSGDEQKVLSRHWPRPHHLRPPPLNRFPCANFSLGLFSP